MPSFTRSGEFYGASLITGPSSALVRIRFSDDQTGPPTVTLLAPDDRFGNPSNTDVAANVAAAVEAGIDVIDASCGGIGGCPFAPSATGNVATEDVVYMLERAGFETGLDLSKLIATANWLEGALGHPVSSSLSRAGAFPG